MSADGGRWSVDRVRSFVQQVVSWFRMGRERSEMDEEFAFHIQMETEQNLRAGMSPAEARRAALLAFGSRDWHAEAVRQERGGAVLEDVVRDLRFGLRNLGKRPVFALAAVVTLSVGVGMTTTMFTLVDAVLLSPLPGENTEGMVYLELESADGEFSSSPSPQLLRLVRDHSSSFSGIEAYTREDFDLTVDGEPLRVAGARASVGLFSFLGVRPALGRAFLPGDASGGGNPVVLLSHDFWVERFGESRDVLGRTVGIGDGVFEVIGVLPRDFRVDTREQVRFWIAAGADGGLLAEGAPVEGALAKLAEGVSLDAARAELDAIVRNNPLDAVAHLEMAARLRTPADLVDPSLAQAILVLQTAALLVLLIGCGNLANLLLAQGETRSRELALRASLGAGRGRLIRQLLVESSVVGALGAVGGIVLTIWALGSLPLVLPPEYGGFALNRQVFLFAAATSLFSILAAGLLPALKGSNRDLGEVIKGSVTLPRGLAGWAGARQLLVAGEVAMAFVLLTSSGLLLKSFNGLMDGDVGFDREDLLLVRMELPEERYADAGAQRAFFRQLSERLRRGLPDQVGTATLASGLVDDLSAAIAPLVPETDPGGDEERRILLLWGVAENYFDVMGVPLLQGPGFAGAEGWGDEEVVVIGETVARRFFPGTDPVGKRLSIRKDQYRIVGVAGSLNLPDLARSDFGDLQLFFPLAQDAGSGVTAIVRVRGDLAAAVELVRGAIRGVDASLPILEVSLAEEALADSLAQERSNAFLMILFALTALVLGAVGIYGVVAYSVSRRIREMGIRLALGASSREVVTRVVVGGMTTVGLGMLVGALGTIALGAALADLLFQVSPRDPGVFLLVATLTAAVALLSTWLPAKRAAGSGPVEALRSE